MRFVIVTGMSGGGKSTALRMLEDMGFFCVDNLPIPLISTFSKFIISSTEEVRKVALGIDIRSGSSFSTFAECLLELHESGYRFEILFMDADDSTLLKRYKETRRLHPLCEDGLSLQEGILKERELLLEVHKQANYTINTSNLLTRELKLELDKIFVRNESYNSLIIHIVSFGFKYGVPIDSDMLLDVRFLPNPFYIDELKPLTGNDKPVQDYVMSFEDSTEFLDRLDGFLNFLIPGYIKEGKYQLVIAIGCTGGKHRSVTLSNALYDRLKNKGNYGLNIRHRDIRS